MYDIDFLLQLFNVSTISPVCTEGGAKRRQQDAASPIPSPARWGEVFSYATN